MCWLAWEKLTKAKSDGGLGIRDIQAFNVALLAKLAWRIFIHLDCLLSRILSGKYGQKKHFIWFLARLRYVMVGEVYFIGEIS